MKLKVFYLYFIIVVDCVLHLIFILFIYLHIYFFIIIRFAFELDEIMCLCAYILLKNLLASTTTTTQCYVYCSGIKEYKSDFRVFSRYMCVQKTNSNSTKSKSKPIFLHCLSHSRSFMFHSLKHIKCLLLNILIFFLYSICRIVNGRFACLRNPSM